MPAGFSKVTIANMALSHIGSRSTVENIDEPIGRDRPAKVCKLWYEPARIATLESFNWSFARRTQALALHSVAAPEKRWIYRYQYPENCLAAREIENPLGADADAVPFDVEEGDDGSKSIVTDAEDAVLIFTRNIEDPVKFSMHFTVTVSLQLAVFIITELSGKMRRKVELEKQLSNSILLAPAIDATERVPKQDRDAPWIRARA